MVQPKGLGSMAVSCLPPVRLVTCIAGLVAPSYKGPASCLGVQAPGYTPLKCHLCSCTSSSLNRRMQAVRKHVMYYMYLYS